jgi:hypothetical protein
MPAINWAKSVNAFWVEEHRKFSESGLMVVLVPLLPALLHPPLLPPTPDALQPARMPNNHKILFFQMIFQAFESISP